MSIEPEQRQGLIYSIGLHLALVLLLFMSTQHNSITPPKGVAIQAEIMDLDEYMKNLKKPELQKPKPVEKKPVPKPKDPPKAEPKKPEPQKKEPVKQEIKSEPKPVIKPKVNDTQRQEKSERMKKLEELRRQRELAENQPAEKPKETPQSQAETEAVQQPVGTENGAEKARRTLLAQYIAVIQSAVTRQWARPSGTPAGLSCQIKVNQIPGGGVIDVSIGSPCNASAVVRNSIINAVKKADPLPYTGFEEVFERRITFTFLYQGD